MRRLLLTAFTVSLLTVTVGGCGPKTAVDEKVNADNKSGADGKRSGARAVKINDPVTDEVSFANQDMTDWYQVELKGKGTVLSTEVHWDNDKSDLMIDVFDEFGKQISASPVRNKGSKQKSLLTPIDKPGTYYVRVSAPGKLDGTVYTVEAKWDAPPDAPVVVERPRLAEPEPEPQPKPQPRHREPREPKEPKEKPVGETVQGRIVSAYREGAGLTLHLDKGSAAGVKPGQTGNVLNGSSGEDLLDGGEFKITSVLDGTKSVGKTTLRSIGRNTRVVITVSR